eukprot:CAMPEP_0170632266 /NCGR_PEP_ID=MMETSP0224-20130122/35224_1 /TAXON_ID=285029 /ORGANISM="Togula jolla, Strain CCCM 725" /LENGTH=89 /DNA_ID=CAMNT_0010960943 /DNA_START=396 /DNA_END=665 /DNA_ORIENTATION=-
MTHTSLLRIDSGMPTVAIPLEKPMRSAAVMKLSHSASLSKFGSKNAPRTPAMATILLGGAAVKASKFGKRAQIGSFSSPLSSSGMPNLA